MRAAVSSILCRLCSSVSRSAVYQRFPVWRWVETSNSSGSGTVAALYIMTAAISSILYRLLFTVSQDWPFTKISGLRVSGVSRMYCSGTVAALYIMISVWTSWSIVDSCFAACRRLRRRMAFKISSSSEVDHDSSWWVLHQNLIMILIGKKKIYLGILSLTLNSLLTYPFYYVDHNPYVCYLPGSIDDISYLKRVWVCV